MSDRPIVIAHHPIWTGYGWWLPNDPRGSTSNTIRDDVIRSLGELHHGRKQMQPASVEIRRFYDRAADRLKHPLLMFTPDEAQIIADALEVIIRRERYTCYACAIMPDHMHILIRKHKHKAEDMIAYLQEHSRLRLRDSSPRLNDEHPIWGGHGWKVFLDHPDGVWRTIHYIEHNPTHAGLPAQHWRFVKPYDNWPLHAGHNPHSPYARRLDPRGFRD